MPDDPQGAAAADLRAALAGVRALVLDADGVLLYRGSPIPDSPEALVRLREARMPYRVVTNFSSAHRSTLAAQFSAAAGIPVDPAEIITAASAAAAYTRSRHPRRPLLVLGAPDARREWADQELVDVEAADERRDPVAAVVIGDVGDELRFGDLDVAFRQLHAGAELVAMHRNAWWMTPKGFTLDAGALVAGLEFALGRRAVVCGKPSPVVFRQALAELRAAVADRGESRLRAADVAMVGDDPVADVAAARRVGLRGIFVASGKTSRDGAAASGVRIDASAANLSEVVAALPESGPRGDVD